MNRRVQQALDGELAVTQLTAAEREELAAVEQAIAHALAHVPDPGPSPDVTGAVMWRVARLPAIGTAPGGRRRLAGLLYWLWQPHPVRLRPVMAIAMVALLLAGSLALGRLQFRADPADNGGQLANQLVQFRLGAVGVSEVALVGDFGGWNIRYPMEQVAPGVWSTALPLAPGVYDYAFVVDGMTWVLDPLAPAVADGFGGANSRLSVLGPDRRART
jgi:hypothetical protein